MTKVKRNAISQTRQQARRLLEEIAALVGQLLNAGPLRKGSLYRWRHRCGRSGCHCAKGPLHEHWVFSYLCGKRLFKYYVPEESLGDLRRRIESDRRFRQSRRKLAERQVKLLEMLDQLGELLQEPFPPRKEKPP